MKKPATSRTGWWLAGLLQKHSHPDRAPYWNNYRLVRAQDWRTAFRRATEMGRNDTKAGNEAFTTGQEFIGVSDLVPIYDEFEDGAEILWQELSHGEEGSTEPPLEVFSEFDLAAEFDDISVNLNDSAQNKSP